MLISTTDVLQQLSENPKSETAKGVANSCIHHNNLFISEIIKTPSSVQQF